MDSGWLLKQGNSIRKGWRPRWFWIDHEQHCLKYAEKQGEKPLGSISFATVQARVNNSSSKPFAIDFVTPNRTYYVAAKSQEEQLAWIDLFRRATKAAIDGVPLTTTGATNPSSSSTTVSNALTSPQTASSSDHSTLSSSRPSSQAPTPQATTPKLTDVLDDQTSHRPVLVRVMSAWNAVKSTTERGVLYLQDPITSQYTRKVAEVRGDNLFLYSSEAKATQRRNSSSSIVLTMCQVRPGRLPSQDDQVGPASSDDAIFRVFSLVTPTTTLYFMGQTVAEASRWIRVFQQIQKVSRERARADSLLARSQATPVSPRASNTAFIVTQPTGRLSATSASASPRTSTEPDSARGTANPSSVSSNSNSAAPSTSNSTIASTDTYTTSSSSSHGGSSRDSSVENDATSPRGTVDSFMPSVRVEPTSTHPAVSTTSPRLTYSNSGAPPSPRGGAAPSSSAPPSPRAAEPLGLPGSNIDILAKEIPTIGLEALDANVRRLLEILNLPQNRKCADCRDEDPLWAVINLGIFICLECSGIHRSLGTHISKVRSVDLDRWDDSMVEGMASLGNDKSNAIYEAELKYPPPTPHSSRGEKDMFIKSKYQWRQFVQGASKPSGDVNHLDHNVRASATLASMVFQEGHLTMSSESEKGWRQRWVVLKDNKLGFYKARADPEPRLTINLSSAHVKSTTLDRINTFELVVPGDVFYLQADNSSDFFLWMDLMRTSQKLYKSGNRATMALSQPLTSSSAGTASSSPSLGGTDSPHGSSFSIGVGSIGGSAGVFSGSHPSTPSPIPEEVTRTGWLYKQGEKVKNWKKRWFVLKDNKLTYYSSKTDKQPKGSIALSLAVPKDGVHEAGTSIKGLGDSAYTHTFEIVVTGRVYYIAATSGLETRAWVDAIRASKKSYEALLQLSMHTAKNKDLALSSPERALETLPVVNKDD